MLANHTFVAARNAIFVKLDAHGIFKKKKSSYPQTSKKFLYLIMYVNRFFTLKHPVSPRLPQMVYCEEIISNKITNSLGISGSLKA
jgi:hypothetical protein